MFFYQGMHAKFKKFMASQNGENKSRFENGFHRDD